MNRFPDFNKWHEVPPGATVPAGTSVLETYPDGSAFYMPGGLDSDYTVPFTDNRFSCVQSTEQPILSPEEEKIEKRARAMFYLIPDVDAWEHKDEDEQDAWRDLARKYVEKED